MVIDKTVIRVMLLLICYVGLNFVHQLFSEAIWRTFTSVSMPSSTVQSPVYGGHSTTETSISVDIVLNNSQNVD